MNKAYHFLVFGVGAPLLLLLCRAPREAFFVDLAILFVPPFLAYFVHRIVLSRHLRKDGLRLTSLRESKAFSSAGEAPKWWEWRQSYDGIVTLPSGQSVTLMCKICGAVLATVAPEVLVYYIDTERTAPGGGRVAMDLKDLLDADKRIVDGMMPTSWKTGERRRDAP